MGIWKLKWTLIIVSLSAFKLGRGSEPWELKLLGFVLFAAVVASMERGDSPSCPVDFASSRAYNSAAVVP